MQCCDGYVMFNAHMSVYPQVSDNKRIIHLTKKADDTVVVHDVRTIDDPRENKRKWEYMLQMWGGGEVMVKVDDIEFWRDKIKLKLREGCKSVLLISDLTDPGMEMTAETINLQTIPGEGGQMRFAM